MGSLFSGPKINTPSTKRAIGAASNAASNASSNINQTATAAANGLTQLSGNLNKYLTPIGYNAGGLSATYGPNGYTVTPDANRQALIDQLYGGYNSAAVAYGDLRSQWTPGESALRAAQLASIEDARQANISNLRENMAKRGVLGSSFAQDAFTRANLENEQQKNSVIANTYLQELDAQHQLIGDQYTAATNAVSAKINELNLEGDLGLKLTSGATDLMKQAAQLRAELATNAAQLKVSGATNAGQILTTGKTNVANITSENARAQAQLDAQAQAGAGALLGTLALAPLTGGTSLLGAGLNLASGSTAFPTAAQGTITQAPSLFGGVSPYVSNASNGYFYDQPAGTQVVSY